MIRFSRSQTALLALAVSVLIAGSACGFKRKKYENPITKDTQQPDKILYDKAIRDIEHGRYEVARLTLNTLINTYDTSEYLAKAKLAVADSWYREGGTHGLSQAEAEYKDFILFYPGMEEAAESQKRICDIHYAQMEKSDRDPNNALRAEYECKQLITQFPNSKFVPATEDRLRKIQEALADAEMKVGDFYHHKGANAAAMNRLGGLVDQYPLYSKADYALWLEADSASKMGKPMRAKEGEALQRIVRDYPLSAYADLAKKRLRELEMEVPEADPKAVARMKWEAENRSKPGMFTRSTEFLRRSPDMSAAAKSGTPTMTNPKQSIPVSVPTASGTGTATGVNDVTISPVGSGSALDTKPDARATPPAAASGSTSTAPAAGTTTNTGTTGTSAGTPADGTAAKTDQTQTAQSADPTDTSKSKKKKKKTDKTTKTDQPKPNSSQE